MTDDVKMLSPYSTEKRVPTKKKSTSKTEECTWPTQKFCVVDPTQPVFHWLALGFCVGGNTNFMFHVGVTQILAFLDTNMLVYPRKIVALGV